MDEDTGQRITHRAFDGSLSVTSLVSLPIVVSTSIQQLKHLCFLACFCCHSVCPFLPSLTEMVEGGSTGIAFCVVLPCVGLLIPLPPYPLKPISLGTHPHHPHPQGGFSIIAKTDQGRFIALSSSSQVLKLFWCLKPKPGKWGRPRRGSSSF